MRTDAERGAGGRRRTGKKGGRLGKIPDRTDAETPGAAMCAVVRSLLFYGVMAPFLSRVPGLVWSAGLAVATLAGLAVWDESRESAAALDDFAENESLAARLVADEVRDRFTLIERDARDFAASDAANANANANAGLNGGMNAGANAIAARYTAVHVRRASDAVSAATANGVLLSISVGGDRVVDVEAPVSLLLEGVSTNVERGAAHLLLLPPNATSFRTSDGGAVSAPFLRSAFARGLSAVRLDHEEAAALGLPARTAFAGIAGIDTGHSGRFGVVLAASAERERDRERRAGDRIVVGVLLTGGLVTAFAALALRRQKKQLELESALAVADVERKSEERLEAASRAATLGTMALGIAHELSTPLSVIAGRAQQILGRATSDERSTTSARAILDQTERIGEVVRGFLGLARGQTPAIAHLAPADVVEEAVSLVEHRFAKAQVALVPNVDDDLPAIHGDARLLEQALVNLLLNACDACEPGRRVTVEAHAGGGFVCFVVVDEGAGISPEHLTHVMEPFFTTKRQGEGTGLGLAVALEIAKSHRGTLTLLPGEPRGTRAQLCIPVAPRVLAQERTFPEEGAA